MIHHQMTMIMIASLFGAASMLGVSSVDAFVVSRTSSSTTSRTTSRQTTTLVLRATLDQEEETSTAALRSMTFFNVDKDNEPDVFCDFLMEIGACSASITDADAGTPYEVAIFREPTADTAWQDSLHWASPVWNRCNVTAHFPASVDLPTVLDMVRDVFPEHEIPSSVEYVPDQDWVIHVQSTWKPIVVGDRFVLTFPWHKQSDIEEAIHKQQQKADDDTSDISEQFTELKLQGGVAFGTGEHPTTQLCLEWLTKVVPQVLNDKAAISNNDDPVWLMDYGAGSGILGMAACKLAQKEEQHEGGNKKQLKAIGVDIDVDACRIANDNAQQNQVDMQNYLPPLSSAADDVSKAMLLKARQHALSQLEKDRALITSNGGDVSREESLLFMPDALEDKQCEICVANILAGPLIALAPTLAALVLPGGYLGLSGILEPLGGDVVQAYKDAGFQDVQVEKEQGGWVLVTGVKGGAIA